MRKMNYRAKPLCRRRSELGDEHLTLSGVHQGKTTLENCVLQCETTGLAVRTSAELVMKNSDLYGAKVKAGTLS